MGQENRIVSLNSSAARGLTTTGHAIIALARGAGESLARWRPAAGEWSLIEILHHLYDEDREDFRERIELTLRDPSLAWPAIDPQGWVSSREYRRQDWARLIERFEAQRHQQVQWLTQLDAVDWNRTHAHPSLGSLRAGDLLASWVAHDLLHLRQMSRVLYQYLRADFAPYGAEYAGQW
jgi:hypothetical protein